MKRSSAPAGQLSGAPRPSEVRDTGFDAGAQSAREPEGGEPSYQEFEAVELYCPKCGAAVPVHKRLLLVLPEGEEYEYLCSFCSSSLGTRFDKKN